VITLRLGCINIGQVLSNCSCRWGLSTCLASQNHCNQKQHLLALLDVRTCSTCSFNVCYIHFSSVFVHGLVFSHALVTSFLYSHQLLRDVSRQWVMSFKQGASSFFGLEAISENPFVFLKHGIIISAWSMLKSADICLQTSWIGTSTFVQFSAGASNLWTASELLSWNICETERWHQLSHNSPVIPRKNQTVCNEM